MQVSVFAAKRPAMLNEPMTFVLAGNGGSCSTCEWISGIGAIGRETPQKLRDLIARYPVSVTIYLDSPGGELFAGFNVGRVLRKAKLNTNVGETAQTDPKHPGDDTHPATGLAKTNLRLRIALGSANQRHTRFSVRHALTGFVLAGVTTLGGCSEDVLDPKGPIASGERLLLINSMAIMLVVVVPVVLATLEPVLARAGHRLDLCADAGLLDGGPLMDSKDRVFDDRTPGVVDREPTASYSSYTVGLGLAIVATVASSSCRKPIFFGRRAYRSGWSCSPSRRSVCASSSSGIWAAGQKTRTTFWSSPSAC